MKNWILAGILFLPTLSFADLSGTWIGKASMQRGQAKTECTQEELRLDITADYVLLVYGQCGHQMGFGPTVFLVQGNRVFLNDIQVGKLTSDSLDLSFSNKQADILMKITRNQTTLTVSHTSNYYQTGLTLEFSGEFNLKP